MKLKIACLSLFMLVSGTAIAASQAVVDNEASEYVNRTSLSKQEIRNTLITEEKFDPRSVDIALENAEKEWGGPEIWNEKAEMSAETALDQKKLSCSDLLNELVQRRKFTVAQANYAAKAVNVCK